MLKVTIEDEASPLEQTVDADIEAFNRWFLELQAKNRAPGDDQPPAPLVRSERAILKTYLWWKVKGEADATRGG